MTRTTSSLPVSYAEQLANEVSTIQARIAAPSGDRIRMVGSTHFVLPDGTDTEVLEGVVVDFLSANLFFDAAFNKDSPQPPACFAVGVEPTTLIPTRNSPDKQSDTCTVCPNNQFGSAGNGKACKNTRLLAVKALGKDEIYVLSVPPTSIKYFDTYVQTLAGKHRLPPVGVLTKISLDKSSTFAAPRFEVVRPLDETELPEAMEARASARERLATEPDFSQYKAPARKKR
jgi:hypothetical protein